MIMGKLGLPIPQFKLKRRVLIKVSQSTSHDRDRRDQEDVNISVEGRDMYGFYFSFLTGVSAC